MLGVRTKNPAMPVAERVPIWDEEPPDPDTCDEAGARNDEWLATLAHELRSPLTTVLYALEVVSADRGLGAEARRACDVAERQARRATQLVEDLFVICAGGLNKLPLRKEVVSLAGVVRGVAETAGCHLVARGHRLTVSLPSAPVTLDADPGRLEQVLTNLLTNAAKFTAPGGHVRLVAEVDAGEVVVRVRDNGRGITSDLLPRVFDLFHQGLASGDVLTGGGLGIGLALVKSVVESHGGRVAAFSAGPGTGSEFIVRLPVRA